MEQSYDDDLLKHLRKSYKKTNSALYKTIIIGEDAPPSYLYYLRKGNSGNEQEMAEHILFKRQGQQKKFSDEYLLDHLRELAKQLGRTPSGRDIAEAGIVKVTTLCKHFGSLGKAEEKAGLPPGKNGNHQKFSNKDLLNHLKNLAKRLGRTPTTTDISKAGIVSDATYYYHFGSFTEALKKAGLVPNK
jgi:hypothetical protein